MKPQLLIFLLLIAISNSFSQNENSTQQEEIYTISEEMPEFKDGTNALIKFITDHLIYPDQAIRNKTEGRVIITFVVDKKGKVTDPVILKSIGDGCDEEAIRVINLMPKWIPGKQDGKPVSVKYTIPLMFTLPKK